MEWEGIQQNCWCLHWCLNWQSSPWNREQEHLTWEGKIGLEREIIHLPGQVHCPCEHSFPNKPSLAPTHMCMNRAHEQNTQATSSPGPCQLWHQDPVQGSEVSETLTRDQGQKPGCSTWAHQLPPLQVTGTGYRPAESRHSMNKHWTAAVRNSPYAIYYKNTKYVIPSQEHSVFM